MLRVAPGGMVLRLNKRMGLDVLRHTSARDRPMGLKHVSELITGNEVGMLNRP